MNKLNLDITKYSCNELQDIFNIENIVDYEQVDRHINTYKNNIFTDNNLSLSEKDNMTNFLNKVIKKITNSLNKNTDNNIDSLSNNFSNKQNNLIKNISDNHPIILNKNSVPTLNTETYKGRNVNSSEYPTGYINPINIKTIKKNINIDTRFRSPYFSTLSSDFNVSLPESFKKVVNMQLTSIAIPLTIYAVSKSSGNTSFMIDSKLIEISEGNYSSHKNVNNRMLDLSNNIVNNIVTALDNHNLNIDYTIDPISGKSKFTNKSDSSVKIYFNKNYNGEDDLETPLPLKLGWLMGFRTGTYELDSSGSNNDSIESEGILSIIGPKYIYICINDYTNAANNNFTAAFTSSTLSPHIIARINYQSLVQSNGVYNLGEDDDFGDAINRTREYFGPVDIQKLHFQILDEYGRVINFNNMDWSCAITFSILYE